MVSEVEICPFLTRPCRWHLLPITVIYQVRVSFYCCLLLTGSSIFSVLIPRPCSSCHPAHHHDESPHPTPEKITSTSYETSPSLCVQADFMHPRGALSAFLSYDHTSKYHATAACLFVGATDNWLSYICSTQYVLLYSSTATTTAQHVA